METLIHVLDLSSSVLLWPVLVFLALLILWILLEIGGLLREFEERRVGSGRSSGSMRSSACPPPVLQELELRERLERTRLVARLAPMAGLMGTLIPMGPALLGFSRGDLTELTSQVVVAFSTTVLGLLVSILALAITHVRRRWYARDLAEGIPASEEEASA